MHPLLQLRPLERYHLEFAHTLTNDAKIMRYWFEEPYETLSELNQLYDRHIQDQRERRFVCQNEDGELVGLVELMELNYIHRSGEFQIIIAPRWQGKGYAQTATRKAIDYAFRVLNLNKVYLVVDRENTHAIRLYDRCGFKQEGLLIEEFFSDGAYRDALRMYILQRDYLMLQARIPKPALHHADGDTLSD